MALKLNILSVSKMFNSFDLFFQRLLQFNKPLKTHVFLHHVVQMHSVKLMESPHLVRAFQIL